MQIKNFVIFYILKQLNLNLTSGGKMKVKSILGIVSLLSLVLPIHIFGQCPSVSRPMSSIVVKPGSELPHDGWAVWSVDGKTFMSRLKNYAPVEVKNSSNASVTIERLTFSSDGKWIVGGLKNAAGKHELALIRISDKKVFPLGRIVSQHVFWYYNSPLERSWDNVWEIGYMVQDEWYNVYAVEVNLSNPDQPKLERTRKLMSNMTGWNGEEFSVAGDKLIRDNGTSHLFTIPNGGRGVLTTPEPGYTNYYPVKMGANNCATQLSPSVKYWSGNQNDRSNITCVPGNHDGFFVVKTKSPTDPIVTGMKWQTDTAAGAVSVCFVPATINGISQNIGTDNKWFGWKFLNNEDYVAGFHLVQTNQTNMGGYVVNHKTGTYYEIIPATANGAGMVAWFDNIPCPTWDKKPKVQIEFLSPTADTTFKVGATTTVKATAFSENGAITKVEFYLDNVKIATDNAAPYETNTSALTEGNHFILAKAFDVKGDSALNSISVKAENDPIFTSLKITPPVGFVAPGCTTSFKTQALDQYGRLMNPQPQYTVVFSVDPLAGTINSSNGVLTAKSTGDNKTYTVSADASGKKGQAAVTIVNPIPLPAGYFKNLLVLRQKVDTNKVAIPIKTYAYNGTYPLVVGQTAMTYLDIQYTWANKTSPDGRWLTDRKGDPNDGTYYLGLTCISPEVRKVVVSLRVRTSMKHLFVNGINVLTSDITKTDTTLAAEVKTPAFTLQKGINNIVFCVSTDHNGKFFMGRFLNEQGAEMSDLSYAVLGENQSIASGLKLTTLTAPATYKIGDVLPINWLSGDEQSEVDIEISTNNGLSWSTILTDGTIEKSESAWGHFNWTIPETLEILNGTETSLISLVNKNIKIKVKSYRDAEVLTTSAVITITKNGTGIIKMTSEQFAKAKFTFNNRKVVIYSNTMQSLQIYNLRGQVIFYKAINLKPSVISLPVLPSGIYTAVLKDQNNQVFTRKIDYK